MTTITLEAPAPLGGTGYIITRGMFDDHFHVEPRKITGYILNQNKTTEVRTINERGNTVQFWKLSEVFPSEAAALAAIPDYESRYLKRSAQ